MQLLLFCLTPLTCLGFADSDPGHAGYLFPRSRPGAKAPARAGLPYAAKEGDLIFYDDHSLIWTPLFVYAGTGPPLHVGIVVKKPDGKLAVLEAGPDDTIWVKLLDLGPRLHQFQKDFPSGTITIRRCKSDLTQEQSEALTQFAQEQDGKRYAVLRLLLQATRFRSRGPVRELFLAHTYLDRSSWICSELVVAAGTVAGLFPTTVKANVTYPLDIVNNRRYDLSAVWHDARTWRATRK